MIIKKLHWLFRLYAPGIVEGEGGGRAVDRGDDHVSTDDEVKDETKTDEVKDEAKTDEVKDEDKGEDKTKLDSRIPASRHKAILEKERERGRLEREALQTELAKFKQGDTVAQVNKDLTAAETSLAKMEQEYGQLLADGHIDKATAKMSEIRRTERGIIESKAEFALAAAEARAVETVRYSTTLERVESSFPELNEDHEDYDKVKAAEVIDLKQSFQARGYTPSVALQRAVKYVMGEPETRAQKTAVEAEARVDPDAVKAETKSSLRKEAQVKKNIDTALKQPASTTKVGLDSDKAGGGITAANVIKMTHADFSKLDEATLSRMRGDELV